eukprot:jgi/Mesen1/8495/ME000480S07851
MEMFGWMYERYDPRWWWWFLLMTCARRLVFVAISVFLQNSPSLQAVLTLLLILSATLLQYVLHPCRTRSLNVITELLLLGQFLYLLGGMGNTIPVSKVISSTLAGVAVLVYLLCTFFFIPYDVQRVWAGRWVRRWALVQTQDEEQEKDGGGGGGGGDDAESPGAGAAGAAASAAAQKKKRRKKRPVLGPQKAELPGSLSGALGGAPGEKQVDLVPLTDITDWFHPRVILVFLKQADPQELEHLLRVRLQYSANRPLEETEERVGTIMYHFPTEMQYAAILELLYDDDNDGGGEEGEMDALLQESLRGGSRPGGAPRGAKAQEAGPLPPAAAPREAAEREHRIALKLHSVGKRMMRERKKARESMKVLFTRSQTANIVAWLMTGGPQSAEAMRGLVSAMRSRLLLLKLHGASAAAASGRPEPAVSWKQGLHLWLIRNFP